MSDFYTYLFYQVVLQLLLFGLSYLVYSLIEGI